MIQRFVDRNCQAIFKYPLFYLCVLLFLTGIASYYYVTLPTVTSLESLLFEEDPDLLFYEELKEQFGDNVTLVVGFSAADVFSPNILEYISEQTTKIEELKDVDEVISLSNVENIIGSDNDFIVQPLLKHFPSNREEQENLRKNALDSSLIREALVNPDSQSTLFLIIPTNNVNSPASDAKLVSDVKRIFAAAQEKWPEIEPRYAGGIQTRLSLTQSTNRDMMTFMPLTYLFLIVLVFIILRNPWLVFLAIINVSLCLVWTLATLNFIGGSMGPMTSILPPLMMALAVSDSIHIFTGFLRKNRVKTPVLDTMKETLNTLTIPCFLTSLTTAIGFLSLVISDVPPIRDFGLAAAIGMMLEFTLSMTIIPLGIYFLRHRSTIKQTSSASSTNFHTQLTTFSNALPKYSSWLLRGSLLLIAFSLIATTFLQVETNLLEFFKKNSPIYQDALFVDQRLGGTETLEVSIRTNNPDQLLNTTTLQAIEKVEQFLNHQEIVSHVSSINDYLREMNKAFHNDDPQWFRIPDSRELAAQYLLLYDGKDIENVLDPAHQWTHIAARINVHSSIQIKKLIEDLQTYITNDIQATGLEIRLSGQALIANKLIDYIISSQIKSLALAFVLIFIVMFKIFKSFKLGLISIIPNSLPILFNFAIMGVTGIPLNSATAIIAAVAIGIAVDDTIHLIHAYQEKKNNDLETVESLKKAIVEKGVPLIATSLILSGAFGILLLSNFVPTIQFGLLVMLIMLFAILSDLLILPCLLLKYDS